MQPDNSCSFDHRDKRNGEGAALADEILTRYFREELPPRWTPPVLPTARTTAGASTSFRRGLLPLAFLLFVLAAGVSAGVKLLQLTPAAPTPVLTPLEPMAEVPQD
ncbi:MAG: hypothetical protein C4297_05150 [Gemmataceae bacterium]